MRITLVISSMRRGGAERVVSMMASDWAEERKQVTLLTLDHGEAPAYPIHENVDRRSLYLEAESKNAFEGLLRNLKRVVVLRRALRASRPDVVISFGTQTNVLTLIATRGLKLPVIIKETIDPLHYSVGPLWGSLRRLLYPSAAMLVCPTNGSLARFKAMTKVRGIAIGNVVEVPSDLSPALRQQTRGSDGHILIAMGRLDQQKGFDLLLNAFSQLAPRNPEWSLTIIGKGPLQSELQEQSKVLGLDGKVNFAGELQDPFPILRSADLFVFSSRFEAFGMALAEAMACGLPVVSFDCPEGPRDMIRDGIDGVLVPPEDVPALAAALNRLMNDAQERNRLAMRAREITTRYTRENIMARWQQLFDDIQPQNGKRK
jgi:GalNAc-alpha-(1->4)-GalNAc-alpha-(1->3)-diNAcBac-PP-undecaprenol alpha-1,4-N-acetyl-D-galactosaminyltransferase